MPRPGGDKTDAFTLWRPQPLPRPVFPDNTTVAGTLASFYLTPLPPGCCVLALLVFLHFFGFVFIISTLMHIPRYCFYCLSQSTSSFCIIDYFNGKDVYPPLRLSQLSSLIFSAHTSNEHFEAWYLADRCIYYWVYAAGIISAFRSSFFTWLGRKTMNNSTSKSPRSLWEKRGTAILSLLTSCMCDRFTCK